MKKHLEREKLPRKLLELILKKRHQERHPKEKRKKKTLRTPEQIPKEDLKKASPCPPQDKNIRRDKNTERRNQRKGFTLWCLLSKEGSPNLPSEAETEISTEAKPAERANGRAKENLVAPHWDFLQGSPTHTHARTQT